MTKPVTPVRTAVPLKIAIGDPLVLAGSHALQTGEPVPLEPVVHTAGKVVVEVAHDEVGAYGGVSR